MAKAMAIKGKIDKNNKNKKMQAEKSAVKTAFKKSSIRGKIWAHNGFIAIIFGLAMALTCIIATEGALMIAGFAIGKMNRGQFSTPADMIAAGIALIMTCSFVLFFAFKLENILIKGMKRRFWHSSADGLDIDKPGSGSDSDMKLYTPGKGDDKD